MNLCPNGHEVSDNVKFCPECGVEVKDNGAKYCAKCGNERKGTEKFCSQCGTPYGQSPTSNVSETNVCQGISSKKGILIAAIVAVIALLGAAAWYFLGNRNIKDEEVKIIVQAKVDEKRKEEERHAEEERKRIEEEEHRRWEEENKGVAKLYKDASERKNAPWCVYSFEREYRKSSERKQIIYVIWLYPSSETSGEAHFVQFHTKFTYDGGASWIAWTPDKYYSYSSGKDYYCISPYEAENGEIHVEIPVRDAVSNELMKLSFRVSDDAKSLTLLRQGWQFKRGCGTDDPFK